MHTSEVLRDDGYEPVGGVGSECLAVYDPRLLRDGWRSAGRREAGIGVFEKPAYASIQRKAGRGCQWDEHELVHPRLGTVLPMPGWEWSEVYGARLAWAQARTINDRKFQALAAPY